MTIVPDTKDWTWVLQKPCPECRFETQAVARDDLAGLVGQIAAAWPPALAAKGANVGHRPQPACWSALEYACHVRDVFRKADERLELMLSADDPGFADWDQDATAVEDRYGDQGPAEVLGQLTAAADVVSRRLSTLSDEQWSRPGRRSDGARFTVESFARYVTHDPVHHLYDVGAPWSGPGLAPAG